MKLSVEGRKNKGSITVEAAIIVPLMILSIAAAVYIGLLLYQRALVQSAAERAAEAGAVAWASGLLDMGSGKPSEEYFEEVVLYRRIFDTKGGSRLECIKSYARSAAERNELIKPVKTSVEVLIKDYAVYRKLEVEINKSYNVPFGRFLKLFGGSGLIDISVRAVSTIDEPVELIRTTDFILDIEKKIENQYPELKNFGEKTRNIMNDLKTKLTKFMD